MSRKYPPTPFYHQDPELLIQGRLNLCFHVIFHALIVVECCFINGESSAQATFFHPSIVQFYPVWITASVSCSWVSVQSPVVVWSCCSPSVLCIQRNLVIGYWLCRKIPVDQHFLILKPARLASRPIPHSKSFKSPFFLTALLGFNFSRLTWSCLNVMTVEQIYRMKWTAWISSANELVNECWILSTHWLWALVIFKSMYLLFISDFNKWLFFLLCRVGGCRVSGRYQEAAADAAGEAQRHHKAHGETDRQHSGKSLFHDLQMVAYLNASFSIYYYKPGVN